MQTYANMSPSFPNEAKSPALLGMFRSSTIQNTEFPEGWAVDTCVAFAVRCSHFTADQRDVNLHQDLYRFITKSRGSRWFKYVQIISNQCLLMFAIYHSLRILVIRLLVNSVDFDPWSDKIHGKLAWMSTISTWSFMALVLQQFNVKPGGQPPTRVCRQAI